VQANSKKTATQKVKYIKGRRHATPGRVQNKFPEPADSTQKYHMLSYIKFFKHNSSNHA
jgi:hypothetical protein